MSDPALRTLQQVFGYEAFRGEQHTIIQHVIAGGDALVLMPTGGANPCVIRFRLWYALALGWWFHHSLR